MKKLNKKEIFIKSIPLLLTLLSCVLLISYAYYKIKLEGQKEHFISTDTISFSYIENEDKISITSVNPLSDTDGKAQSNYFEFNVSSNLTSGMSVDYEILISRITATNNFNDSDVKIYLTDGNNNQIVEPTIISNLVDNSKIIRAKTIYTNNFTYNNSNAVQVHTYRLRVWLKEDIDMNNYISKTTSDNTTNISLSTYEYKFKVNVNTIKTPLATETLISQTDNLNDSGLYTIVHNADSTLQIGATESVTEYRYRGANPKNYVTFNNEVWRIIGVFPTEDENGNIENRIKLIRNESIGNNYWSLKQVSSTSSYNNWTGATLKNYLNGYYYNTLTSEAQSMISSSKYYLGGYISYKQTSVDMYSYERKISGSNYYYGSNPNSWVGKIALMYESDYGYASLNCETKALYNSSDSTQDLRACNDTNWLYNIKTAEWLLPQFGGSRYNYYAFNVFSRGNAGNSASVYSNQYAVRPVLYLTLAVQITGGEGTESSPYTLGV